MGEYLTKVWKCDWPLCSNFIVLGEEVVLDWYKYGLATFDKEHAKILGDHGLRVDIHINSAGKTLLGSCRCGAVVGELYSEPDQSVVYQQAGLERIHWDHLAVVMKKLFTK